MEVPSNFFQALWYSFTNPTPSLTAAYVLMGTLLIIIFAVGCYYIFTSVAAAAGTDPRVSNSNVIKANADRVATLEAFVGEPFNSEKELAKMVFREVAATAKRANADKGHVNQEGFASPVGFTLGSTQAGPAAAGTGNGKPAPPPMISSNSLKTLLLSVPPEEQYLVNFAPLTASIGGYIGPINNGVFNPEYYIPKCLRAGIRSFVLPIGVYYDDNKKPPNWQYSGKPAIVCRDVKNKIISLNGTTVEKFCQSLITHRDANKTQKGEPIILYIHATENIPDPAKNEKDYVQLTSDIAKELQVLDPTRLILLGSYGSAVGAERQSEILTQTPLSELEGKILIFTNFDIHLGIKKAYDSISPNLYDYVNFVYKPLTAANVGTTSISSAQPSARSIHVADVSGSTVNWADQARVTWFVTAQDSPLEVPLVSAVENVTKSIQGIPVPFLSVDLSLTRDIWDLWGGYAWRLKPEENRYSKPPPIIPQNPSTKLNARVDDSLHPGQTLIK